MPPTMAIPWRPTIGVWCMRPTKDDVRFAASLGINRLDIMINELSKSRAPQRFEMVPHDYARIATYAGELGIHVQYTSWVMPHVAFCDEMVDRLLALPSTAHLAVLDAEEPWSQAERPQYDEAIETLSRGMAFAVTGIGWASKWTMRLAQVASEAIPQLYSTTRSGLQPREYGGPESHWKKWNPNIVPALAAYRTTPALFAASFAEVMPCPDVRVWALRHLRSASGRKLHATIKQYATGEEKAA